MNARTLGDVTLHGWREKAASRIGRRAPLADDLVRAALGVVFFALSVQYVVRTLRAVTRELRG